MFIPPSKISEREAIYKNDKKMASYLCTPQQSGTQKEALVRFTILNTHCISSSPDLKKKKKKSHRPI